MGYVSKLACLLIVLLTPLSHAQVIETWECKELRDKKWNVVVIAEVLNQNNLGRIRVAGIVHSAYFRVKGFNRRWDFGESADGTFDYALVIKPDGEASYYEFEDVFAGQEVQPTHRVHCVPITS